MVVYAEIEVRTSELSGKFGLDYATLLFGPVALLKLDRYQGGPKRGLLKGKVEWVNCTRGGWSRQYGVVKPGKVKWARIVGGDGATAYGRWHGRINALAGVREYLFPEGRAHFAEERARFRAEEKERDAEFAAQYKRENSDRILHTMMGL